MHDRALQAISVLASQSEDERQQEMSARLAQDPEKLICQIHTTGGDVDADVPLMSAGLDSLGAVELSELLQKAVGGPELPGTLVFDQPTARKLLSSWRFS